MGPENVGSDKTWAKSLMHTALFSLPFYDMTPQWPSLLQEHGTHVPYLQSWGAEGVCFYSPLNQRLSYLIKE